MSISGFFANAACGPKAHSDTAPEFRRWLNDCLEPLDDNEILQTADRVFSKKEKKPMFAASVEEFKTKLLEKGRQEGRQEGKQEGSREIARKLKQSGIALEIISKNTGQGLGQNDGFGLQARRRKVLKAECTCCT